MRLIEYKSEYFEQLRPFAERIRRGHSLGHRPFVDYYYTTSPWCRLYLFLGNDDTVLGTIGVDQLRFEWDRSEMRVAFGNNYFVFQSGIGGVLFMRWLQTCPYAAVFGGSADTHRIIQNQKWTYFKGVKTYS